MKRLSCLLVMALSLLVAGSAVAEKLAFQGSLSLQFTNFGGAIGTATGTGVATVNGSNGFLGHLDTLQVPPSWATITTILPITDPVVTAGGILSVRLTGIKNIDKHNVASGDHGRFGPISGAAANTGNNLATMSRTAPLAGLARICTFVPGCVNAATITLPGQTGSSSVVVDDIGVGGTLTTTTQGVVLISIFGAPWALKTVSVINRTDGGNTEVNTRVGIAHGPSSLTSSTAVTSGTVQLVTAAQITTVNVPGQNDLAGLFGTMNLHFAPEPGLLLLLGSGAAGLALLGRKRIQR